MLNYRRKVKALQLENLKWRLFFCRVSTTSSDVAEKMEFSNSSNLTIITRRDIIYTHCFVALFIDRAVTPLWYIIGITGNVVSAAAWLQPRMRKNSSSAIYLSVLSVNDTLFLLLHPLQELKYAWFLRSVDYPGVCETYAMVFLVTQYLAPVITFGFSVDRYVAVCHPFQKKRFCTVRGAVRVVAGSVLGCLALGAIQPYLWTYDSTGSMECSVREEAQRGGQRSLWSIWSWVSELVVFLLVPLLNLLFNVMVIREIYHLSKSGRQANSANVRHLSSCVAATNAMLLLVSFYVIFTTLPATIVYVLDVAFPAGPRLATHEQIANDPMWRRHLDYVSFKRIVDEVCLSHYACNFFLFAATGTRFRRLVSKMLFRGTKNEQRNNGSSGSSRKSPELNAFIISNVKRGRMFLSENL